MMRGVLKFGRGAGRIVVVDARISPLRDGTCTIGMGANGHHLVNGGSNVRRMRLSNGNGCIVSGCASFAVPQGVRVIPASKGKGAVDLLATAGPLRTCGVPRVAINALGTTSNGASLCCHLVGPIGFSPGGGCPTMICICNKPRTRLVRGGHGCSTHK